MSWSVPVRKFGATLLATLALVVCHHRGYAYPSAAEIVRRAAEAEGNLNYVAEQVTITSENGRERRSRQNVMAMNPGRLRVEFVDPPEMKGQIIVVDGTYRWKYVPQQNLVLKGPILERGTPGDFAHKRADLLLRKFSAEVVGTEQVAGREAYHIRAKSNTPGGPQKDLWIDTEHFLRLKLQQSDPCGKREHTSYFTRITFNPRIDPSQFRFTPPAGAKVVTEQPTRMRCFRSLEELRKSAPFEVRLPTQLPPGFAFLSGTVGRFRGKLVVWIRWTDGLLLLSLFERPVEAGEPKEAEPRMLHKGCLVATKDGYHLVVAGRLPEPVLRRILESVSAR